MYLLRRANVVLLTGVAKPSVDDKTKIVIPNITKKQNRTGTWGAYIEKKKGKTITIIVSLWACRRGGGRDTHMNNWVPNVWVERSSCLLRYKSQRWVRTCARADPNTALRGSIFYFAGDNIAPEHCGKMAPLFEHENGQKSWDILRQWARLPAVQPLVPRWALQQLFTTENTQSEQTARTLVATGWGMELQTS